MFKQDLIIVRHARSRHNVGESESLDDSITNFGQIQATNVGRYLHEVMEIGNNFNFYTSPFLRCLETSRNIQEELEDVEFKVMWQLREYLNHAKPRELFIPNRSEEFSEFSWGLFPKEGELYHEEFNEIFLHRMEDCHARLSEKSVVVTHGLPAFALLYVATTANPRHVPIWDYSIDNASITWIKRGRVIWHGKNLYHEMPNDRPWPNDSCMKDILKT